MARFNYLNSFKMGQVSRKYCMRDDLGVPANSAELVQNMIPLQGGGLVRRPGSMYMDDGTAGGYWQMIPFVFSETEVYNFYFDYAAGANHKVRNTLTVGAGGLIAPTISSASGAIGTGMIQFAQSADTLIMVNENMRPKKLVRTAANTFTFDDYIPNTDTKAAVLAMAFRKTNISAITMTAGATTGLNITLTASAPYFNAGMVGTIFKKTNGGVTGACRVVSFTSTTVVRVNIIIDFGAAAATTNWQEGAWSDYRGWPTAISFADGRLVLAGNTEQADRCWASLTFNYGIFMQDKLAQDATTDVSGLNYFGDVAETDAYDFGPASQEVNKISWISFGRSLFIGTLGCEYAVTPGVSGNPLSRSSTKIVPVSKYGSARIQPVVVGQSVVFVSADRQKLVKLYYDETYGTYKDVNLNALQDDLPIKALVSFLDSDTQYGQYTVGTFYQTYAGEAGFTQIAYDPGRNVIWAVANGQLVGCTLAETGDGVAWHEHVLGGRDAKYEGFGPTVNFICVTPNMITPAIGSGSASQSFLWLGTYRLKPNFTRIQALTTGGAVFTNTEVIMPAWNRSKVGMKAYAGNQQNFYLDAARPATAVDGLGALLPSNQAVIGATYSGEVMSVLADDKTLKDVTVSVSGTVTLDKSVTFTQIGFKMKPKIKSFPLNAGGLTGPAFGTIKRIDEIRINFYRSLGAFFGPVMETDAETDDKQEEIQFRDPDDPMNQQIPLFTGTKLLEFDGDYEGDPQVQVTQEDPLPLTILGWVVKGVTNET